MTFAEKNPASGPSGGVSPEPGHLQGHWADDVILLSGDEFSCESAWSQLTSSVHTVARRFLGSPNRFFRLSDKVGILFVETGRFLLYHK